MCGTFGNRLSGCSEQTVAGNKGSFRKRNPRPFLGSGSAVRSRIVSCILSKKMQIRNTLSYLSETSVKYLLNQIELKIFFSFEDDPLIGDSGSDQYDKDTIIDIESTSTLIEAIGWTHFSEQHKFKSRLHHYVEQYRGLLVEVIVLCGLYGAYQTGYWIAGTYSQLTRSLKCDVAQTGSREIALANAERVLSFESYYGLSVELPMQRLFILFCSDEIIRNVNRFYMYAHVPCTLLFFVWTYNYQKEHYYKIRNGFMVSHIITVFIECVFPCAPPRMLTQYGFIDTIWKYNKAHLLELERRAGINPYAAMPSMHFGYAATVGVWGYMICKKPIWKFLFASYTTAVFITIIITGNHYILDAIVAGLVLYIGDWLAKNGTRYWKTRPSWNSNRGKMMRNILYLILMVGFVVRYTLIKYFFEEEPVIRDFRMVDASKEPKCEIESTGNDKFKSWLVSNTGMFVELLLLCLLYGAYQCSYYVAVETQSQQVAVENARGLVSFERMFGLSFEIHIQKLFFWEFTRVELILLVNAFHCYAHIPFTLAFFIWAYKNHRSQYYHIRNSFVVAHFIMAAIEILFPCAPPILLPELGFRDTIWLYSNPDLVATEREAGINPYAAMPSMRFAYAATVGVWGLILSEKLNLKILFAVYTFAAFLAGLVTGNDWVMDSIVAGCVLLLSHYLASGMQNLFNAITSRLRKYIKIQAQQHEYFEYFVAIEQYTA